MEVASPLTFGHVPAGSKRRYACSPIMDDTQDAMDESAGFGHSYKRRRMNNEPDHNAIVTANNGFSNNVATASPFSRPGTCRDSQRVVVVQIAEGLIGDDVMSRFLEFHWCNFWGDPVV